MECVASAADGASVSATPPRAVSRLKTLVARRVEARREAIAALGGSAIEELRRLGLDATLIGSARSGHIHEHSDIDVLVRSMVTAHDRQSAERAVGDVMKGSGIPYDLLFACDLTADQAREFESGRD